MPRAIALVNRARREGMGGLSSNELIFGIMEEIDQNSCEGIALNQRRIFKDRRYCADEVLGDVMFNLVVI